MSRGTQGFTLLELLVVLAILAGTAVIAMPLLGRTPESMVLRDTAQALAAHLTATRVAAMRNSREQTAELDAADGRFRTSAGRGATIPRGLAIDLTTLSGERAGPTAGRIRFYPDGSSTGGHIVLQQGARRATITVDWMTGATRIDRSGW